MAELALVMAALALVLSALAFTFHLKRTSVTILNWDEAGYGDVLTRRLASIDNLGGLHFSTDGESYALPMSELRQHPGELVWIIVVERID